jgi:protein-tyrosine phosphatase
MDIKVLEKLSWVETGYLDAAFNEINKNMVLWIDIFKRFRNF